MGNKSSSWVVPATYYDPTIYSLLPPTIIYSLLPRLWIPSSARSSYLIILTTPSPPPRAHDYYYVRSTLVSFRRVVVMTVIGIVVRAR